MHILIWLIGGIIAGWLAGLIVRGKGFGLIGDLIIGLLGGLIGGYLGSILGIVPTRFLSNVIVAALGGVILVVAVRVIRRI
jgi:uncharacterized membrane protein YeaQ/YmgE (transglycosylase-associated protein family)